MTGGGGWWRWPGEVQSGGQVGGGRWRGLTGEVAGGDGRWGAGRWSGSQVGSAIRLAPAGEGEGLEDGVDAP